MRLIGLAVVLTFLMKEDIMRILSGFLALVFTADTGLSAVLNLEQIDGVGRLRSISMIPTNEELMIASHTLACIRP